QFTWGTYCDWYLELIKPILSGENEDLKKETRATAAWVLDQILLLLHPFMPFLTEELAASRGQARGTGLIRASWPELDPSMIDANAADEVDWVIRLVTEIRAV